ncbi:MAG: glutathione S-transferase [Sphingomonadales bacterium]|nr:glutathione S-transferase [Sphingomonadales bacterium]
MTYRLYHSPGSCSTAPHIVLEEIGAPYELELVSSRGERDGEMTGTPEWRAINPKGRVPALRTVPGSSGGAPGLLTEAAAIMVYLALAHPEKGLFPQEPAAAARCLEWLNWLGSNVHTMSFGQIWRAHRFTAGEDGIEAVREQGRRNLADQYAYIERLLGDGRGWAVPEGYSIADPYLLVFFRWGRRVGIDMRSGYPAWSAATDRLLERPAVLRVLEDEGLDIP